MWHRIESSLAQIMACRYSTPSHYLNQCWDIVNWTLRNKRLWNFDQNKKIIQENASENIVCEKVIILSRGRWVKPCLLMNISVVSMIPPSWWRVTISSIAKNTMKDPFLPLIDKAIINSSRYTGDDFMFLYRFVRRRRRLRPQILVYAITFEQLFGFFSFLARLLALTCRLPN